MKPRHALVISSFLALALVLGAASVLRTTQLGAAAAAPSLTDHQIEAKKQQLARYEAQLRKAAGQKPPALPKLPPLASASTTPATTQVSATAPAPRVVYVRSAPIVRALHRHRGDDGDGGDHEGAGDGGGFDD